MIDQAERLRELCGQTESSEVSMNARVIAIASGKGGVGKSNFAVNLAVQMCKLGKKVVIIDADFGLANIEILLGVAPKHSVSDVLVGKVDIEDALTTGPHGCLFLSGGTGLAALNEVSDAQLRRLTNGFLSLDSQADCIIIDTRAGLSNAVINFVKAAEDIIIITTPDPTAIADAYALIKSIKKSMLELEQIKLVVNCASCKDEALDVFNKLSSVSHRFLGIELRLLGFIPYDPFLIKAVRKQKPVSILYPFSESANSINEISAGLLNMESSKKGSIQNFVLKLIGKFTS